jgi:hypothetical protein
VITGLLKESLRQNAQLKRAHADRDGEDEVKLQAKKYLICYCFWMSRAKLRVLLDADFPDERLDPSERFKNKKNRQHEERLDLRDAVGDTLLALKSEPHFIRLVSLQCTFSPVTSAHILMFSCRSSME